MKKLLIVVDYQVDFVNGSLGFEKAAELEDRIAEKIMAYKKRGDEVIFTLDTHTAEYPDTQEGKNLPITHCIENSEGWQLYGKIAGLQDQKDRVFKKPAFGSAELFDFLRSTPYQSIELVGVVSNICVISNAVLAKTAQPETPVLVDAACVASNDPALNEAALNVMESLQIQVINRQ
mgnify:CR=1 FL=1